MVPNTSRWRSAAAYDFIDRLSPSGIAWEYLRRNTDYQADYRESLKQTRDAERTAEHLARRWGLRFRGAAKPHMPG